MPTVIVHMLMESNCMKKVFVFLALSMMVIGICAAQNSDTAQRIVGTWIDAGDNTNTWVFNQNGTGTMNKGTPFRYFIISDKIAILLQNGRNTVTLVCDFVISNDGRTMIIDMHIADGEYNTGVLLQKRN